MCNVVKWLAVRVFQVTDAPVFDDEEKKSFAELQTRIQAMVDLLKSIDPTKAVARENSMSMRFKNGMEFTTESAQAYVSGYALPLFFWQLSSAYGLMRKQGVPITVGDYIKGVLQPVAA